MELDPGEQSSAQARADAKAYAEDRYREVIYLSEYNAAVSAFVEGAEWLAAKRASGDEIEALTQIIEKVFRTTRYGARRYAEEIVKTPEWVSKENRDEHPE